MKKTIIANWKMNPDSPGRAVRLARAEDMKGVVIAPPFPFLFAVSKVLKKAALGAQDVFWAEKGAYTGGVSARMLKNLGASYVIVGHSERRALGETDVVVNRKLKTALGAGLKVVLCVGEPLSVRKKGLAAAKRFVKMQLQKDLRGIQNSKFKIQNSLIVTYEPIWAIGTGKADKPEETAAMTSFIKKLLVISYKLKIKVLYGGSVNAQNAASFLRRKEIDGALIGGTSLKADEFIKIINP